MKKNLQISVSQSIGSVSGILMVPDSPKAILVLAHGAGAGMTHVFMERTAQELYDSSIATLRFNLPFIENQKGRPDPPAIAEKTVSAAIELVHKKFPELPLFAGGKSFGGRMTSQLISKECPEYLKGIVFFGFPLHAPGNPSIERAAHLNEIKVPMLFLQGTRDALAKIELMEKVVGKLRKASLVKYEKADHSFKVSGKDILPELVTGVVEWINKF